MLHRTEKDQSVSKRDLRVFQKDLGLLLKHFGLSGKDLGLLKNSSIFISKQKVQKTTTIITRKHILLSPSHLHHQEADE